MNNPSHKAALGVNPEMKFASCNMEVNQAFAMQGDGMHNSAILLPELIEDGVKLLVYAGNAGEFSRRKVDLDLLTPWLDMMCNYMVCHHHG